MCACGLQVLLLSGNSLFIIHLFFSFQTDEDRPQSFVQSFVLKPANDSFFIQHDMFRLVIHNVAAN